ncbi:hypothetical protein [Burkholderia perseverans]|uniref:hypothetical protein n=1 Tax=Burkholderia perseverans TaxID=2615214 RepID=UPI001FEEE2C4|nr:hypothetical protein [Burkholderia perseverans]
MSPVIKYCLPALIACFAFSGTAQAAEKTFCYFHHNCPADGKLPKNQTPGQYTKQQCKNGGGKSWGDGPTSCENVNK